MRAEARLMEAITEMLELTIPKSRQPRALWRELFEDVEDRLFRALLLVRTLKAVRFGMAHLSPFVHPPNSRHPETTRRT